MGIQSVPPIIGVMRTALLILVLSSLSCGGETEPIATVVPPPAAIPPPAPAPEPLSTPTGLMVSETTEMSVTWTWDPVEGAAAYAVQISMNETFGDEGDITTVTVMPTYTVTDVPPSTTVHLRVAAVAAIPLEDGQMSAWTTPVTGISNAPPPPSSASVRGFLTKTVVGDAVSGATLSAGGVTARSAADGSFALDLPEGQHRLTVSGPGIVERTTTIRAPHEAVALDVIPEDGPWTLDFYRELARNGAGGGDLEPLLPWDAEPTFFIDTRPEPTTGAAIPPETVEFVKEAIRVTVSLLSGGRYPGERIEATSEPPADMTPRTVVLRWNAEEVSAFGETADAFAYRVGGTANVVVFRHIAETWAVHHEIGHVMGLYHPLGGHRPSHMWYSGELEPPHFTKWDIFHAQVLYSRPAGNSDVDVDPAGFVFRREAGSETAVNPVVCSFPDPPPHHFATHGR